MDRYVIISLVLYSVHTPRSLLSVVNVHNLIIRRLLKKQQRPFSLNLWAASSLYILNKLGHLLELATFHSTVQSLGGHVYGKIGQLVRIVHPEQSLTILLV